MLSLGVHGWMANFGEAMPDKNNTFFMRAVILCILLSQLCGLNLIPNFTQFKC